MRNNAQNTTAATRSQRFESAVNQRKLIREKAEAIAKELDYGSLVDIADGLHQQEITGKTIKALELENLIFQRVLNMLFNPKCNERESLVSVMPSNPNSDPYTGSHF